MKTTIEIRLSDDEWSMLNAAADSIHSSPEELARVSLLQRCLVMSEDDQLCAHTRKLIGHPFMLN